ncbi:MAG: hypothetical protein LBR27_07225 [Bifidobacteriaceae bacterium]|jgi:hypothetical protein|nr:hypothetical protein [Bifidobacteriaceae bacterium]
MHRLSSRLAAAALALVVAGLAGCSGDADGAPTPSGSDASNGLSNLASAVPPAPSELIQQIMDEPIDATERQAAQLQAWGDDAVTAFRTRLAGFNGAGVLAALTSSELVAGRPGAAWKDAVDQIVAPLREAFGPYARVARAMTEEQFAAVGAVEGEWGALVPALFYLDGPQAAVIEPAQAVAQFRAGLIPGHPEVGIPLATEVFTTAVERDDGADPAGLGRAFAEGLDAFFADGSQDATWLGWVGDALVGRASTTPWPAMEPVMLLGAYRYGQATCRAQIEGHEPGVYALAMGARFDIWTGEEGVAVGSAALQVPPTVGAGELPAIEEDVSDGGTAPEAKGWLVARRDNKEEGSAAVFSTDALAGLYALEVPLDNLAYSAESLGTIFLIEDKWADVTDQYVTNDVKIYRCSTTIKAINAAEGTYYNLVGPINGESPPTSLQVVKGTEKHYLDCVADETIWEKLGPLVKALDPVEEEE